VSLSIKALKENPWKTATEKYKKDMEVTGVIITKAYKAAGGGYKS
jgi:ribosomal protein S1